MTFRPGNKENYLRQQAVCCCLCLRSCCRQERGERRIQTTIMLSETALLSPSFLTMQKKEKQPAQVFFRALSQLGGRSRQVLAVLPWASKFNSANTTKKTSELARVRVIPWELQKYHSDHNGHNKLKQCVKLLLAFLESTFGFCFQQKRILTEITQVLQSYGGGNSGSGAV